MNNPRGPAPEQQPQPSAQVKSDVQFVFIGGYMHSGTTLLGHVIGNLDGAQCVAGETKFLEFMRRYRTLFPDLRSVDQREALARLCQSLLVNGFDFGHLQPTTWSGSSVSDDQIAHLEVFLSCAEDYLRNRDRWILVEHTGTNVFGWRELMAIPSAFLVDIVRDPRDVLASKKLRRQQVFTDRYSAEQQRRKHFEKSFDPVWDTLSWRTFVRAGQQAERAMGNRYLRVRYEELVRDPEGQLARIGAMLGAAAPPDPIAVAVDNAAARTTRRDGIDDQSVGQWQQVLTPAEASTCQFLSRREASLVGIDQAQPRPSFHLVPLAVRAVLEPAVRVQRRFRLGGVHGGAAIVANYARRLRRGRGS